MRATVLFALAVLAPIAIADQPTPQFRRLVLSEEFHGEGAAIADINGDGDNDIVSGPFWYQGPDFRIRHAYAVVKDYSIKAYSDHFFSFIDDFDGNGHPDILSVPIPGGDAVWYQNPGRKVTDGLWRKHLALKGVGNESPAFVDVDADGAADLVCIHEGNYGFAKHHSERPLEPWAFQAITENKQFGRFTHGLGIGDVDADGQVDLLEKDGWWKNAGQDSLFEFQPFQFAQSGGSQMFVSDFDGDGDGDIVSVQNAHAWGLCWFERRGKDSEDVFFVRRPILTDNAHDNPEGIAISQMHALGVVDIDGDGVDDLVTGKRFFAHGGRDPGAFQLPVLYWLRTVRENGTVRFEPHLISERVGVGTQLTTGDVDGNGHVDIVVGSKLGTFVLLNTGKQTAAEQPLVTVRTDEFKTSVRTTDPLSPQQELKTFILPEGFQAELVASEPDIAKPMNMAFDAKGRLWVSSSVEYPFPASLGKGRDTINVIEDTDGDGLTDKITTFADGLNIPIGLYPHGDGVICFSIPNIWYLRDTDGDGKCDDREILYGPFDTSRDTHGMCNGFSRGFDGWLYACHGFNNQSKVKGRDGNTVQLHSGNTFRMRLDGSRIEHFTHGQVNPFGLAFHVGGDAFTADCHTKPVTLLMRHGQYAGFGRPHDGLGFVPNVMDHLHGSTAIGGIAIYQADSFPSVYHGNVFGGNVMTGRVNRNSLHKFGSTFKAREEADLLISGDPWFRPVDLQIGPDGALYVADFYNRIIGHYEVDLKHPGRDRHRGRIWRIAYRGSDSRRDPVLQDQPSDLSEISLADLGSANLTRRLLAADVIENDTEISSQQIGELLKKANNLNERVMALWVLHRRESLAESELETALTDDEAFMRLHAFKVLAESRGRSERDLSQVILLGLEDPDSDVRRAAAAASAVHVNKSLIPKLLSMLHRNTGDVHLRHAVRMALRVHLNHANWFESTVESLTPQDRGNVLELCLAIKTETAGAYVAKNLKSIDAKHLEFDQFVTFAASHSPIKSLGTIVAISKARFKDDVTFQEKLLRAIRDGLVKRGAPVPDVVKDWARDLALSYFGIEGDDLSLPTQDDVIQWHGLPHPNKPNQPNCWTVSTKRNSADGQKASLLFSSFPKGEKHTGIYRSDTFPAPAKLAFFMAGHDGFPANPLSGTNWVRVLDAESKRTLAQWAPPRNDTAQTYQWEGGKHEGKSVYLELIDGNTDGAYAWLAVGRFSLRSLNPATHIADWEKAIRLVSDFRLNEFRPILDQLLTRRIGIDTLQLTSKTLAKLRGDVTVAALSQAMKIRGLTRDARRKMIDVARSGNVAAVEKELAAAAGVATTQEQREVARELAVQETGLRVLLNLVAQGKLSARLLSDPSISAAASGVASSKQKLRIEKIVRELPNESAELDRVVRRRQNHFREHPGSVAKGIALFQKHCSNCHQVASQGTAVGPNLDGIGNRGPARIMEDVLMPNRNVDAAFRAGLVVTDDGRAVSGLIKIEEENRIVLIDSKGKQSAIAKSEVVQRKQLSSSPMPSNFSEILDPSQTSDLVAYLMSLTQ